MSYGGSTHTKHRLSLLLLICCGVPPIRALSVALCFFGLTRSLELTVDNIRHSILDPLLMADADISIYLHTYDLTAVTNPRSAENMATMNWRAYKRLRPDKVQVDSARHVEEMIVEPNLTTWLTHGDAWAEAAAEHTTLGNLIKQLYSLKQVTKLWTAEQTKADVVLYLRSDVWFFNTLNVAELEQATTHPSTLYTPTFHQWGGLNDRLAFGAPSVMETYGNRLDHALQYSQVEAMHSERFLLHIAKQAGLNYSGTTSLLFERVRATGELWGLPSNSSILGNDSTVFHKQPGLKVRQGALNEIEIVAL